ncbi:metallophosphoesterase [Pseudomonas anatoliensis]|uniref:metallophosphoesterase family protein n=1 Tax=Pseudomonas anatoliensis TaxID=2710589 RepID=UPI001B32C643|nr:metallophosphoesterase [Pseudomonas anatoliensis]MBP5958369.1 metallophosphoesterase [Pseudomonas anatoliensis]
MSFIKNIRLLCGLLLSVAALTVNASAITLPDHIVFTSDPQFPWTENSDAGVDESASERDKRSRWLIETQYSDVASFRKYFSVDPNHIPVMINGDMTAFGHGGERRTTRSILDNKLSGIYDYGLGNHDYENNINDCSFPENNCAAGSVNDLKERYWGKVSMDLAARSESGAKVLYGSLAYSKTFGDVHLVQLNNEPTYSVKFVSGFPLFRVNFEITDALDWLERDLQKAQSQGKIILLNMHKPDRWQGDDQKIARFRAMVERYQVTAVFAGHYHNDPGGYTSWRTREYFGDVPVFLSGGASNQTYLIASFATDRKSINVHQVSGNSWPSRKVIATVPVR